MAGTRPALAAALILACAAAAATAAPGAPPAPSSKATASSANSDLDDIAVEAYWYFYPLILMDITRRVQLASGTISAAAPAPKGGWGPNRFQSLPTFPKAEDRSVVRPNFDTLYSVAWLDLTKGPVILSSQDTGGRYHLLPILDMWTDVFAAPGTRTTGNKGGAWALVYPPSWKGALPKGVERINAPTPYAYLIGRTQANGPSDFPNVHKIQAGYHITPLADWGKGGNFTLPPYEPEAVDLKTEPLVQINTMPAEKFFTLGAELLKLHPPHTTDFSQLARLRRLGIVQGKPFDWAKAPADVKAVLTRATKVGLDEMKQAALKIAPITNGWQVIRDNVGVYGNSYLTRAIIALVGLGANEPADAIYPLAVTDADGKPLVSPNKYEITFKKGELPPVEAFWSLTSYDGVGYQVPNKLNRYALGDRDKLKFAPDGSLTLYLQPDSPGKDKEANWLPTAAKGPLGLTMRLYAPRSSVLFGGWAPPAIKRVG